MTDVRAAFEGDPAATGADEVVFSYPGIAAICVYRIAHKLLSARRRDRAAHDDRARALRDRHRHPSRPPPSAKASSSITAPAWSSARPRPSATACASIRA